MTSRILEVAVALAALTSAVLLGVMLAQPFLPQPPAFVASIETPQPSATAGSAAPPPIGLFQVRGRLAFSGPCAGVELSEGSYPADGGAGSARVTWWTPTAIDPGNPEGCASRAGDLHDVEATVTPTVDEDEPDAAPIGYSVRFSVPLFDDGTPSNVEIVILLSRSTPDQLQALVLSPDGSPGLVLDRVEDIDPPFGPRPSATPTAVAPPNGLFLLRGPLEPDGPCLVLELGAPSYPVDPDAAGTARVRSWEPAVPDADDPAQCLRRGGDVHDSEASVVAARDAIGDVVAYEVRVSLPVTANDAPEIVEIWFDPLQAGPDHLMASVPGSGADAPLVFDRVDAIDPPLVTPSPSAGG